MVLDKKYGGRRNKMTPPGEDRIELLYRLDVNVV